MMCNIKHAQDSDLGQKRENNEDNYICLEFDDMPNLLALGAIDGVGGYAGGEVAAEHCKNTVEAFLSKERKQLTSQAQQLTLYAMQAANNTIYHERKKNEALRKMSCVATMALLDRENERLYFAHVGDSRAYVYRNGELIKITEDHSMVGYLEDIGELTEAEAMAHPRRNEISKLMGEKLLKPESTYIQSGEYSFYSGDIVLFCSDGLTDLVDKAGMIAVLEQDIDLEQKKNALIKAANNKGGKDNITVALATYAKSVKQPNQNKEATLIQPQIQGDLKTEVLAHEPAADVPHDTPPATADSPLPHNAAAQPAAVSAAPAMHKPAGEHKGDDIETQHKKRKTNYSTAFLLLMIGVLLGFLLNIKGSQYWYNRYVERTAVADSVPTQPNTSTDSVAATKSRERMPAKQDSVVANQPQADSTRGDIR